MDVYHIWFDLKPGTSDTQFVERLNAYLGHLVAEEKIRSFRVTRKKLGLGPPELGDFHVTIEVTDLAELDKAFNHVARRAGEVEGLHAAVNQHVQNARFALYRDFPDPVRERGEERF
ncbi:MAG TPA: DUF6614 family protein [Polyangiaceae bacterium]|nr:DUF6614 family protein [Polyangiaceae bacterium]